MDDADTDADGALSPAASASKSSQTVTALSASDSEETVAGDSESGTGNSDSASKRLSDLVGALDAAFSIASCKLERLEVGAVSSDDDLDLRGPEYVGDQAFRREVHVYAF